MAANVIKDLTAVLNASHDNVIEVMDPVTQRLYLLVDAATHRQAMDALQQQEDKQAIAQGIREMEAGEGIPVEEARRLSTERLQAKGQ